MASVIIIMSATAVSAENIAINQYGEPEFIPDAGLAMDTPILYFGRAATSLPLAEYPDGSYYSYNGKECTCHGSCNEESNCNCKKFDGSSQCMAFASYVYYKTHNKMRSAQPTAGTTTKFDYTNPDDVTKILRTIGGKPTGTYIRVKTPSEQGHSIALVGTTSETITIYHANYGGRCLVRYETYTWKNFIRAFPTLDHYVV